MEDEMYAAIEREIRRKRFIREFGDAAWLVAKVAASMTIFVLMLVTLLELVVIAKDWWQRVF